MAHQPQATIKQEIRLRDEEIDALITRARALGELPKGYGFFIRSLQTLEDKMDSLRELPDQPLNSFDKPKQAEINKVFEAVDSGIEQGERMLKQIEASLQKAWYSESHQIERSRQAIAEAARFMFSH